MSTLTIRFLGTSAIRPIPRWGCPQCAAAQTDPRARRTRYTPLLEEGQGRHLPIVEGVRWAREAGARRVIFTHIGHLRRTAGEVLALLPGDGFALAHDGLTVEL